ncbi:MAG: hypothetical protein EOP56_17780 [Sphingobacteriales bacterium]|nr:MAG: hypothetical protein EOP56_17780 [Sphingobacteriales bacterium]
MQKLVRFAIFGAALIASCTSKDKQEFELIRSKTEQAGLDDSIRILLFACVEKNDLNSVKQFCEEQKRDFADNKYQVLVFFDNKDNVVYPQLPDPGLFLPEERFLKHVKAIYRYNYRQKKAKLDYYSNNMWDGNTTTTYL